MLIDAEDREQTEISRSMMTIGKYIKSDTWIDGRDINRSMMIKIHRK